MVFFFSPKEKKCLNSYRILSLREVKFKARLMLGMISATQYFINLLGYNKQTWSSEIIFEESKFPSLDWAPNPSIYLNVIEFVSLNIAHIKTDLSLFS